MQALRANYGDEWTIWGLVSALGVVSYCTDVMLSHGGVTPGLWLP